jgi:hypothetical protein
MGVMEQSVEGGTGDGFVPHRFRPSSERFIGGEDHTAGLVADIDIVDPIVNT